MEISQHIKNLLKTNERVILAGFGAFNTKQISAKYDAETKTMNPPHKIVTFDHNIKEDAGLLSKYMAEQENISLENSTEQIREYVKMINSRLSSGQKVEFKDLGTFNKNDDGSFNFDFLAEDNLLMDSFGLPSVSLDTKNETIPVKQPVTKKSVTKKPEVKEKTSTQKPILQKPVKEKPIKQKPVKKAKPIKEKNSSDKPKKKRKGWLVFIIFIAAIGLMLTAVYFFKPDLWNKGYAFSTEKLTVAKSKISQLFNGSDKENYDIITPDDAETIDTSSVIADNLETTEDTLESEDVLNNEEITEEITQDEEIDETEVEEIVEDVVTNNTTVSPAKKGTYYIIVSSVRSEVSAKKEQKRFSAKGISTSIIHAANIGRYRISAGEFGTIREAQDSYAEIQSKHGNIEAWVWEKK